MASTRDKNDVRRQAIPIIYARGSHYDVGYEVVNMNSVSITLQALEEFFQGRTFASIIQDFVSTSSALNDSYLPIYNTPDGLKVYTDTLDVVTKSFPQYVRELQGTADGAEVDFHKVS